MGNALMSRMEGNKKYQYWSPNQVKDKFTGEVITVSPQYLTNISREVPESNIFGSFMSDASFEAIVRVGSIFLGGFSGGGGGEMFASEAAGGEVAGEVFAGEVAGGEFAGGEFAGELAGGGEFGAGEFGSEFGGSEFGGGEFGGNEFSGGEFGGNEFSGGEFGGNEFSGGEFAAEEFGGSEFASDEFSTTSNDQWLNSPLEQGDPGAFNDLGGQSASVDPASTSQTMPQAVRDTAAIEQMPKEPGIVDRVVDWAGKNPRLASTALRVGSSFVQGGMQAKAQESAQKQKLSGEKELMEKRTQEAIALEEWRRRFAQSGSYWDTKIPFSPGSKILRRPDGTPVHQNAVINDAIK